MKTFFLAMYGKADVGEFPRANFDVEVFVGFKTFTIYALKCLLVDAFIQKWMKQS